MQHSRASSLPQDGGAVSKIVGALAGRFPAKAGPTECMPRLVGPASAGKPLICFNAFDLHTQKAQSPPIATWVQAERRYRGVGRAAWMRRERRQGMDARSARAHGAGPE